MSPQDPGWVLLASSDPRDQARPLAPLPEVPKDPQDTVTVSGGRVIKIDEYTTENGVPGGIYFHLERVGDDKFVRSSGDGHGGGQSEGKLLDLIGGLHPTFLQRYIDLFSLTGLTSENTATEVARVMGWSDVSHCCIVA